jgi:hypothetical protein
VELGDHARRVLEHLATAKGSYLLGKRHGETPLTLIDNAANAEHRVVADSLRLIDRIIVEQLDAAGYLEDNTGSKETTSISFRISEQGRHFFMSS